MSKYKKNKKLKKTKIKFTKLDQGLLLLKKYYEDKKFLKGDSR